MKRNRRFLATVGLILTFTLWFALGAAPSRALDSSLYKLTEESHYIEGCFDPCMCPIFMNISLQGSFQLLPVSQTEDGAFFDVLAVDWAFIQEGEIVPVSGSGLYQVEAEQHRLTLDLKVGDDPVQHFDSGLVPLQSELPGISISVALNDFFCYDYVFGIIAIPAPVEQARSSWGNLKSIYR